MSKGGARPNSGRKKGSIPWNKGIPMSDSSKEKLSKAKLGQKAWNKGKPMSDETKKKLSLVRKGRPSPWKGKTHSPESREKIRLAKLGKPSPKKGIPVSLEIRERMSEGRKKYLLSINPDYDYRLDSKTREGNKRIRRERIRKFGGRHSKEEWEAMKSEYNWTCPSCSKSEPEIKLTRDHILPLSSKGTDDISNIQPLCFQCNSKKYTRSIRY